MHDRLNRLQSDFEGGGINVPRQLSGCKVHTAWSAAWSNLNMKSEEVDASCGGKAIESYLVNGRMMASTFR
jgi:hypothetical protein